jgi:hypothetical protein
LRGRPFFTSSLTEKKKHLGRFLSVKVGLGGLSSGICSLFFIIGSIRIWLGFSTLSFTCERGRILQARRDSLVGTRKIDRWMAGWDGWYDLARLREFVDCTSSMVTSKQTEIDRTYLAPA